MLPSVGVTALLAPMVAAHPHLAAVIDGRGTTTWAALLLVWFVGLTFVWCLVAVNPREEE